MRPALLGKRLTGRRVLGCNRTPGRIEPFTASLVCRTMDDVNSGKTRSREGVNVDRYAEVHDAVATHRSGWQRFVDKAQILFVLCSPGLLVLAEEPERATIVRLEVGPQAEIALVGADARAQLLVTAVLAGEGTRSIDGTRRVAYRVEPAGVARVLPDGQLLPTGDGTATVRATIENESGEVVESKWSVRVERFSDQPLINFPNQIVPIFTKHGCNGGGCHGKSGGQNGFRLSLLGFYPREDWEYLVHESRGRRVHPAAPERSLLLEKACNLSPHGGGERFSPDSHEYRLLRRWMLQGMPYGNADELRVTDIDVYPAERTLGRSAEQQLAVIARYSDGSAEDVTRMATYEPNDTEMAEVDQRGLVKTLEVTGDIAIMVRYQGQVGVFRASIPLGADVGELPEARGPIDEIVFEKLRTLGVPPSGPADDATFFRRVTIDLAGRLPTRDEVRAFRGDTSPYKRDRWIESLLASSDYADYFANKWAALLRNKNENAEWKRGTYAFHGWLRDQLHRNEPYDKVVRSILAASGSVESNPAVVWYRAVDKLEEQVEDSAQLFMGLRLQCARCHHHPFEAWSQRDYYSYAAFFSRVGRKDSPRGLRQEKRIFHRRGQASARNPRSGENVAPAGIGGEELSLRPDQDPRQALVDWLVDADNPFFAKALVNRYWKHFFGRGLVDPEDDMRLTNPACNPKLLDRLADDFRSSGYDLKQLCRSIVQSRVYQLSSIPNEHNGRDRQNFSRFYPRRLQAEVLYDSINQVTSAAPGFGGLPSDTRAVALPDSGMRNYFLTVFGRPMAQSACECERSNDANLAQSLHLLNSKDVLGRISSDQGRAAQLARDAERADAEKIHELYDWVFGRQPQAEELQFALEHLGRSPEKKLAYEDIVWALLNTKEFLFTH